MRGEIIRCLEEALEISEEIDDEETGYLIERGEIKLHGGGPGISNTWAPTYQSWRAVVYPRIVAAASVLSTGTLPRGIGGGLLITHASSRAYERRGCRTRKARHCQLGFELAGISILALFGSPRQV